MIWRTPLSGHAEGDGGLPGFESICFRRHRCGIFRGSRATLAGHLALPTSHLVFGGMLLSMRSGAAAGTPIRSVVVGRCGMQMSVLVSAWTFPRGAIAQGGPRWTFQAADGPVRLPRNIARYGGHSPRAPPARPRRSHRESGHRRLDCRVAASRRPVSQLRIGAASISWKISYWRSRIGSLPGAAARTRTSRP